MSRERLPNRRPSTTQTLVIGGVVAHVSIGFAPDGSAREMFLRSPHPASEVDLILDDIGVLVSLLLQHGYRAGDLRRRLGTNSAGQPSSIVGLALQLAERLELESGR